MLVFRWCCSTQIGWLLICISVVLQPARSARSVKIVQGPTQTGTHNASVPGHTASIAAHKASVAAHTATIAAGAFLQASTGSDDDDLRNAIRYIDLHPAEVVNHLTPLDAEVIGLALQAVTSHNDAIGSSATITANARAESNAAVAIGSREATVYESTFANPHAMLSKNSSDDKEAASKNESSNTFGIDMSKMKVATFTPLLWVMAIVAICGVAMFELVHYRWAQTDLALPVEYGAEMHENQLSRIFAGVWPLVKPYLFQKESNCHWYYIATVAVLGLWNMFLGLLFTLWMKDFWDILEKKHSELFMPVMRDFVLLVSTMIVVGTYQSYIGMMLMINWRKWMTEWLVSKWLANKAFYQLQLDEQSEATLDNPDQRIQEDINIFIPTLMNLAAGFFESIGQLVTMLPLLLILSPAKAFGIWYFPGWLLYLALLYSGLGTVAAHYVGSRLIMINFAKQKYEADLRYSIVQIRDNAESIALYGSEDCEKGRINARFDSIVRVWWLLMLYTKRLGFFTAFYMQTSVTFPYLVLAPNYFKGQITLGTMFMLFRALGSVKGAFDWIISSYSILTDFRATADRLQNFHQRLEQREAASKDKQDGEIVILSAPPAAMEGKVALVANDISVRLPVSAGSKIVWDKAGLIVQKGQFVLLTAPEGSGKSCFFRALAGIWPHASGSVWLPERALFVPQRAHIPQGSLKQALAYPDCEDLFTDKEVRDALETVGLSCLRTRELSEESNWQLALSGGEQQRLAIAHAVLRKPSVLFLDESTGAMGNEGALELYGLLRRPGTLPEGAAVVSISHDIALLGKVHDVRYNYDQKQGKWTKG